MPAVGRLWPSDDDDDDDGGEDGKPDSLASLRPSAAWLASSENLLAIAISLAPAKVRRRRYDERCDLERVYKYLGDDPSFSTGSCYSRFNIYIRFHKHKPDSIIFRPHKFVFCQGRWLKKG